MALRAGYYGVKRFLRNKLETIAGTYDETVKSLFPRSEQAVLGASNLVRSIAVNKEQNGLHFVVNDNKEVAIWGTATAETELQIMKNLENLLTLGNTYYLSGCTGGSSSTYYLQYLDYNGTTPSISNYSGVTPITIFTPTGSFSSLRILVRNGANMGTEQNPTIIKPMIAMSADTPYAPYAMTNRELTEMATTKDVAVTAGTDVTVNTNTHVYSNAGIVSGSMRLEIGATLSAGATIATLSTKPKGTTYAIAIDNTDASVIPIIIGTNGAVQLFASFVPTEGHQLLIPVSFIDDPGTVTNREISADPEVKEPTKKATKKKVIKEED